MTKPATIDILFSDELLAYVPFATPEGEGVSVKFTEDRWYVEGGDSFKKADRSAAEAQAKAIAEEKWGAK